MLMVAGTIPPLIAIFWVWTERDDAAVRWFQYAMGCVAVWALAAGVLELSTDTTVNDIVVPILVTAIATAAVCYFLFCYAFAFGKPSLRASVSLFIPVGIVSALSVTVPFGLVATTVGPQLPAESGALVVERVVRPAVALGFGLVLLTIAAGMVFGPLQSRTWQSKLVLASTVGVGSLCLLTVTDIVPTAGPAALGWAVAGVGVAVSINRHGIHHRSGSRRVASDDRYRRLFDHSSDYVVIVDEDGTITDVTQGVDHVLGYEPDELIGTDAFGYVHPEDSERVRAAFAEVLEQPDTELDVEYRLETIDGEYVWVGGRGTNQLAEPQLGGIGVHIRDITERKERQQELEELTTRLSLALEETDTGIWEWDLSGEGVYWDHVCRRLFGYDDEFPETYQAFTQYVHDDDLPVVEDAISEAIATGEQYRADFRIERPDGETRWIQSRGVVDYDEAGEPDQMVGIQTDVTDRKKAEQAVEETKEYYRRIFHRSSDYVTIVDESETITDVTQGVEDVLGYEPDELIGMDAFAAVHPEDTGRVREVFATVVDDSAADLDIEFRVETASGDCIWVEARGRNHLDDPLLAGIVANIREITQRKERQQELETLTTRLQLALEATDSGVWEIDLQTREAVWDDACKQLMRYDPEEFAGVLDAFTERVVDEDLPRVQSALDEAVETGEEYHSDFRIEFPDGEQRWIRSRGTAKYDESGEPVRMVGIETDITERKRAEQAVEETKEVYERVFGLSEDYLAIVNETGEITEITPGIEHVLGYSPEEIIGTAAVEYIHPADEDRFQAALTDVIEHADTEITVEYRAETTAGDYRWMEARGNNHLDDPLLGGIALTIRDISGRKEREQELADKTARLQQKNTQLERLADVVSHDLQTPLSTAERLTSLLRADLGDTEPEVEQSLADLEATHDRLRAFADHLPRLARESTDVEARTECELQTVAQDAWNVVETGSLEFRIESTRQLDGDPERLQRVFENLFKNTMTYAVQAVDNADRRASLVRVGTLDSGFYVEDDGPGIRAEQQSDLFEYGMTTGEGSGFGLAIVRTTVEAHGWTVEIADDADGARFEITTDS